MPFSREDLSSSSCFLLHMAAEASSLNRTLGKTGAKRERGMERRRDGWRGRERGRERERKRAEELGVLAD
jgi:hypothetical protein